MPKSDRYYLPVNRPGDTPRMKQAVAWAETSGLDPFYRPDPKQLKFGNINFWPDTGTVTIDGKGKHTGRGLDAFKIEVMRVHFRPDALPDCEHLRDQDA